MIIGPIRSRPSRIDGPPQPAPTTTAACIRGQVFDYRSADSTAGMLSGTQYRRYNGLWCQNRLRRQRPGRLLGHAAGPVRSATSFLAGCLVLWRLTAHGTNTTPVHHEARGGVAYLSWTLLRLGSRLKMGRRIAGQQWLSSAGVGALGLEYPTQPGLAGITAGTRILDMRPLIGNRLEVGRAIPEAATTSNPSVAVKEPLGSPHGTPPNGLISEDAVDSIARLESACSATDGARLAHQQPCQRASSHALYRVHATPDTPPAPPYPCRRTPSRAGA